MTVSGSGFTYTGAAQRPAVSVTLSGRQLAQDTDYTVDYSNNVNAGTATVTITGKGNYQQTASATFAISPANLSGATAGRLADAAYTGKAIEPLPTLTFNVTALVKDRDYSLSYAGNVNAGTATVTATGMGNYAGTLQAPFGIMSANIANATCEAVADMPYTGGAVSPALKLTFGKALADGVDYTVSYSNNTAVGTAQASVTGKGNFTGSTAVSFRIVPADIRNAVVALTPSVAYTGAPLTPAVSVTLAGRPLTEGVDYLLSWRDNTQIGANAAAVITGIGNYAETLEQRFEITMPANVEYEVENARIFLSGDGTATYLRPAQSSASVVIPDVISVGDRQFSVTAVAEKAFKDDGQLVTLTLGRNIKVIGTGAFEGCVSLKTVNGGSALVTIGNRAFKNCRALKSIVLGKRVKKIGKEAFYGCKSLKKITFKTTKLTEKSVGSNAFKNVHKKAVFECPKKKLKLYKKMVSKKGAPKGSKCR